MTRRLDDLAGLTDWLEDRRLSAFVLGPGFGVSETTRLYALALVGRPTVFDADAITAFAGEPESLFAAISRNAWPVVLTPHAGEFGRLFPDLTAKDALSKIDKARAAAARSGAVVLLKGADTVVAAPDGRAVVNASAPPGSPPPAPATCWPASSAPIWPRACRPSKPPPPAPGAMAKPAIWRARG